MTREPSRVIWSVTVSGFRLELWVSRSHDPYSPNFTMLFSILAQPTAVSITYLGQDAEEATALFCHKVEVHRRMST
jgi:hypothetical protein